MFEGKQPDPARFGSPRFTKPRTIGTGNGAAGKATEEKKATEPSVNVRVRSQTMPKEGDGTPSWIAIAQVSSYTCVLHRVPFMGIGGAR